MQISAIYTGGFYSSNSTVSSSDNKNSAVKDNDFDAVSFEQITVDKEMFDFINEWMSFCNKKVVDNRVDYIV